MKTGSVVTHRLGMGKPSMLNRDEVLDWCAVLLVLPVILILMTLMFFSGTGTDLGSYILSVVEAPLLPVQLYFGFRILRRRGMFVMPKFLVLMAVFYITVKTYLMFAVHYAEGFGV